MWELAKRNLLQERTRLLASAGGVAFSVVLMLLLLGLYNSYQQRIEDYFGAVRADLWVVQSGTSNFFHSSSVLPAADRASIEALPGVRAVDPYVGRQIGFVRDGREFVTYVVGVPDDAAITGPISVVSGSDRLEAGEIALNRSLAETAGLGLGSTLDLRGRSFRVAALTDGGDMVMYQYSLVTMADALALQGSNDIVNFFLVRLDPGAPTSQVAASMDGAVAGAEAWTPSRVVTENQGPIKDTFLPVIGVLVVIGLIVGTTVIALTTYSGVIERRREYGVLKALGADGWATFRTVLVQSAIAGSIGYLIGVAVTVALSEWLPSLVPQFAIQLEARYVVGVLLGVSVMIAASVALPVSRLSRIDPAEVFQS